MKIGDEFGFGGDGYNDEHGDRFGFEEVIASKMGSKKSSFGW